MIYRRSIIIDLIHVKYYIFKNYMLKYILRNMDADRKRRIEEQIDDLMQSVIDSDCDDDLRELFIMVSHSMKTLNDSIESAHHRLDNRKIEFEELLEEFRTLSKCVSESNIAQKQQTEACKKMLMTMDRQIESMHKSSNRQLIFTVIISSVTLVSMFDALKGASTAASIWNIVKVLVP